MFFFLFAGRQSSELTGRYSCDQLVGRKVVVLCNANPEDKRGIERNAMVLCAVDKKNVELINPPFDSLVGTVD